ncbi:MAG TPA: hypothetical protein PKD83_14430, partial [Ignavibacteria bacterium]|nr:hypothetical protein [Ignavibacteria bacterium]
MRISSSPLTDLEALSYLSGYFFYSATVAAGQGGNFYIRDASNNYNWRKDINATSKAAGRNINYCCGILFAGDNGLIMKADSIGLPNGGEQIRWRVIPSGTNKNLHCITGGGGSSVYIAVGDDGTIIKSSDNGETWNNIPSPVTDDLYGCWLGYAYLI